jgi:hypothetical protein
MKIAISYRRADSAGIAGRVLDHMARRYGPTSVFIDIDDIPYGMDFRSHIRDTLSETAVLLALVGMDWAGKSDRTTARIMAPDDPVRVEIEIALENDVPTIPVLIGSAQMPGESELPSSISTFAFLNAAPLDIGRNFHVDMGRLCDTIDVLLTKNEAGRPRAKEGRRAFPSATGVNSQAFSNYRRWSLPILCGVIALTSPFGAALASLAPPWPVGVSLISCLFMILVVAVSFEMMKGSKLKYISRLTRLIVVLMGLSATLYFTGVSRYTYKQPGVHGLWAKGFVCTPEALRLYKNKCPDLGLDELSGAEFHEDRLWTSSSIGAVQQGLALLWFIMIGSLSVIIGGMVAARASEFAMGAS